MSTIRTARSLRQKLGQKVRQDIRLADDLGGVFERLDEMAFPRTAGGKCKQVTGGARAQYLDVVWDMFVLTYSKIGLKLSQASEMMRYPIWELCFGPTGEAVSFNVYKKTAYGMKSALAGHDGSSEGKRFAVSNLRSKFKQSGYYGEVSHKVEAIAIAAGAPAVCNEYVPTILKKKIEPKEDGVHYTRNLRGVGMVTKILVGNPTGIPTTDAKNPTCPAPHLAPDRVAGNPEDDDAIDELAHYACMAFTDADYLND